MYWIVDADTGETPKLIFGGFDLVWYHDRRWLARKTVAEEEPAGELDILLMNDEEMYAPPDDDARKHSQHRRYTYCLMRVHLVRLLGHRTTCGSPSRIHNQQTVSSNGVILREKLTMPLKYETAEEWPDDAHLQLTTGTQTFKFAVNGSEVQQSR